MSDLSGKVILHTLMNQKQPVTMKEIVALIAQSAQVPPEEVKPTIIDILENGVRYGFIQRSRGRYFVEDLREDTTAALNDSCSTMASEASEKRKVGRPRGQSKSQPRQRTPSRGRSKSRKN